MSSALKRRIIIDTDPGVDDVLAILLALSASPQELEVVMLSVSYGNVALQSCLRNVITLFHVLEKEMEWRRSRGEPEGYESLKKVKPIVAVGAEHPLEEEFSVKDSFHGSDGIHGVHQSHPDLSPSDTWKSLFKDGLPQPSQQPSFYRHFTPSRIPAHIEILRLLKESPRDTISICVIGPMTNVAMAAAEDPETFLRVRELVVMGGAVERPGNVTPVAEFNTYADAVAAARVFALTSMVPAFTMPIVRSCVSPLPDYPQKLARPLKLSLFPLDITTKHTLKKNMFLEQITPRVQQGSPLSVWVHAMMSGVFDKVAKRRGPGVEPALSLHDPLTVWYMITHGNPGWKLARDAPEDIRIETSGQWTHGMSVSDQRGMVASKVPMPPRNTSAQVSGCEIGDAEPDSEDRDGWLSAIKGNKINRYINSPSTNTFALELMQSVFG